MWIAGFELFTDLVLADFLVTYTPYVSKVVFQCVHPFSFLFFWFNVPRYNFSPKLIPWFVSDVTPPDFKDTFSSLSNLSFFSDDLRSEISVDHLQVLVARWTRYLEAGIFSLSVPLETPLGGGQTKERQLAEFWTAASPYWCMEKEAPEAFDTLKESALVIFKGDLK